MNPHFAKNRHPIVMRRGGAWAAVIVVLLGITSAMSGGNLLAAEADRWSLTDVHADLLGPSDGTTFKSAEPATVTSPPRTSIDPADNSTNNFLRVVFRRFSFVLFAGVLGVASMASRRLFGRR